MKMKQPDLGRKIAELRKSKGYTQEELVDICHLSVRTLQRIESGEVSPRSYTLKVIFSALEYEVFDSSANSRKRVRIGQLVHPVFELFNLKTNTMKKLSILSLPLIVVVAILLIVSSESKAQSIENAQTVIDDANKNLVRWFNAGQVDSILTLYAEDACIVAVGCGTAAIRSNYESQVHLINFQELQTTSLSVCDSIAIEKGRWTVSFDSGELLKGEYLTEWCRRGKTWLMVNDISDNY
jgi:transcriptional regulator with XRE-family HTH domain